MKTQKTMLAGCLFAGVMAMADPLMAVPTLQLDIENGVYVGGADETVYSTTGAFDLHALIDGGIVSGAQYFVSIAIVPTSAVIVDFGTFTFAGITYDNTDTTFGTPPVLDPVFNPTDIGSHGIYDTAFIEVGFTPDASNKALEYNSANNPGGLTPDAAGTLIYESFAVDVSGLYAGFGLHFDLYTIETITRGGGPNETTGTIIGDFAPFSHDAQTGNQVPDGGTTIVLLGAGLLGVGALRRRLSK